MFFRTALLDYTLYRQYFPLWALSLYEKRRSERPDFSLDPSGDSLSEQDGSKD